MCFKIHPITVTWRVVFIIIPILITLILSVGVGMILATISVFFKDVENLYDVFTLLLFYMTPIVYHVSRLGFEEGTWQIRLLKLNPLYGLVGMFRAAVLWGTDFVHYWDMNLMYYSLAFSALTVIIGFFLFYKYQDKFILHI